MRDDFEKRLRDIERVPVFDYSAIEDRVMAQISSSYIDLSVLIKPRFALASGLAMTAAAVFGLIIGFSQRVDDQLISASLSDAQIIFLDEQAIDEGDYL